jgi:hypothetical protein
MISQCYTCSDAPPDRHAQQIYQCSKTLGVVCTAINIHTFSSYYYNNKPKATLMARSEAQPLKRRCAHLVETTVNGCFHLVYEIKTLDAACNVILSISE